MSELRLENWVMPAADLGPANPLPAFGDGYFLFTGPVRGNWDLWSSPGTARTSTNNHLAFVWGTGIPIIDSIAISTPTNGIVPYDYAASWTAILTDPNFHLAMDSAAGSLATVGSAASGAWSYNVAGTFPVAGTSPGNYQVFVIGWGGGFADPAAAAAAGAPVGWSSPFTYSATTVIGTPLPMVLSGFLPFGVGAVPEPTTLAFAGLGAAALLIFRRRR